MNKTIDFIGVLDVIKNLKNPEIWHVSNSTHPGIGWSIKSVMPFHEVAEPSMIRICDMWTMLSNIHPNIVKLTNKSFDWNGNELIGWKTIWIRDGLDIKITLDDNKLPKYEIITFQNGSRSVIKNIIDKLQEQIANSNNDEKIELESLLDICETIISQVSEFDSQNMRKNFKVIDD